MMKRRAGPFDPAVRGRRAASSIASTTARSMATPRPDRVSNAVCTYPSCASAAARNDSGSARLPITGCAPRFATLRAFSLLRTSAVTSCPPRTSASSTAPPMYPVAPVRKIRIAAVYHSSLVVRDTLIDFFGDLSHARGEFLVHDDGFRSRSHSYADVTRAARGFAALLHGRGLHKGD